MVEIAIDTFKKADTVIHLTHSWRTALKKHPTDLTLLFREKTSTVAFCIGDPMLDYHTKLIDTYENRPQHTNQSSYLTDYYRIWQMQT
jgi:hypothetical protein